MTDKTLIERLQMIIYKCHRTGQAFEIKTISEAIEALTPVLPEDVEEKIEACRRRSKCASIISGTGANWFDETADMLERLAQQHKRQADRITSLLMLIDKDQRRIEELENAILYEIRQEEFLDSYLDTWVNERQPVDVKTKEACDDD